MSNITKKDIDFVKTTLSKNYIVKETEKQDGIRCFYKTGIIKKGTSVYQEKIWDRILNSFREHFGVRFLKVFHNGCFNHLDFIIYVKQA